MQQCEGSNGSAASGAGLLADAAIEAGWLARYQAFAQLMATVQQLCPRLPVFGMSLMHPRHAIPPDHVRVMEALTRIARVPSRAQLEVLWMWCVLFACRDTVKLVWVRVRCGAALRRALREPAAVVMKTWRFSSDPPADGPDFYYGSLPEQLDARGIRCLLLYGDARGVIDGRFARSAFRQGRVRSVPELLLIPLWAPLVTACRQLAAAVALRRLARRVADDRVAAACAEASHGSVQPYTLRNVMAFYIARSAVKAWRPRAFVTLYEGQPWELPARLGAKAADRSCVTVGYQHTVVMPHSLSLLRPPLTRSQQPLAPDVVLCLGSRTRAMMAPGHERQGNRLVLFGSFRRPVEPASVQTPQPGRHTVLVLPEGILTEEQVLFNFGMRVAAKVPEVRLIFRCHPLLPFEQVRSLLDDAPERFPNVEISRSESIASDFAQSSVVLYRGSSAALYAVLRGLKPVYLHDERFPDVDPLFELNGWRDRIADPEELGRILHDYAALSPEQAAQPWRSAAAYVQEYTQPVDETSIDRFLEAVGLT